MRGDLLDLPLRRRIHSYLRVNPGVHFREILRDLELSSGQLDFHLNEMVKGDILSQGDRTWFYKIFRSRQVFDIREEGIINIEKGNTKGNNLFPYRESRFHTDIDTGKFTFSGPNLSYHLKRMEKAGLIRIETEGRERRCFIVDIDEIKSIIISYRETLMDKVLDIIS